jgi:hypothetical protein
MFSRFAKTVFCDTLKSSRDTLKSSAQARFAKILEFLNTITVLLFAISVSYYVNNTFTVTSCCGKDILPVQLYPGEIGPTRDIASDGKEITHILRLWQHSEVK